MEISRRGGFTRNFEGKERTIIFSLSSGDTGLLHNESYILSVSFLSVTRRLAPAHKARTSPPWCLTLWQQEPFLQLKCPGFSITFPAAPALLLPLSLPPDFFSLKEKSVNLNFLLNRPYWETDMGLIRWYLFFFSAVRLHESCFPPPAQLWILPDLNTSRCWQRHWECLLWDAGVVTGSW